MHAMASVQDLEIVLYADTFVTLFFTWNTFCSKQSVLAPSLSLIVSWGTLYHEYSFNIFCNSTSWSDGRGAFHVVLHQKNV